jgi:AcrR family transcriptional regulator
VRPSSGRSARHDRPVAAPVGLTREQVVDAAVAELDAVGRLDGVALRAVAARLGVRTQSLYAHVDGADGLRRALALRGLEALGAALAEAVDAVDDGAAAEAIEAVVRAYLRFARERPGLYEATVRPREADHEVSATIDRVTEPLRRVLASFGLDEDAARYWYRIVFAATYGLIQMRRAGIELPPREVDETVCRLVRAVVRQVEAEVATAAR